MIVSVLVYTDQCQHSTWRTSSNGGQSAHITSRTAHKKLAASRLHRFNVVCKCYQLQFSPNQPLQTNSIDPVYIAP